MRLQSFPLASLLQALQSFVSEHKARQVAGVGIRGLQNGFELVLQTIGENKKKKVKIRAQETCIGMARYCSNPYLPLLNRKVITRACGALILAPYLNVG